MSVVLDVIESTCLWVGLFATGCVIVRSFLSEPTTNSNNFHNSVIISNRLCSMTHALGTIYLASNIILSDPSWIVFNTSAHTELIVFSLSYYIADLLYVTFVEHDRLFIAHHSTMISYWSSALYLNAGGAIGCYSMILGEITTPLFIVWSLAKKYRTHHTAIAQVYKKLSPPFTYFYIGVRGIVMPVVSPLMWRQIISQNHPSLKWRLYWIATSVGVIFASSVWCRGLWNGYQTAKI
jgi:hypothetical protein